MRDNTCAVAILDRLVGDDIVLRQQIKEAKVLIHISQDIFQFREEAGLTQAQLAQKIGVTPEVIEDLEEADYAGDSELMLQKICDALGKKYVPECALAGSHE